MMEPTHLGNALSYAFDTLVSISMSVEVPDPQSCGVMQAPTSSCEGTPLVARSIHDSRLNSYLTHDRH
jgi:hypothetical protein